MDIEGAKALKKRLGPHGADQAPAASADIAEDAPPVYHWLGVSHSAPETPPDEEEGAVQTASLFSRLGLSLR